MSEGGKNVSHNLESSCCHVVFLLQFFPLSSMCYRELSDSQKHFCFEGQRDSKI